MLFLCVITRVCIGIGNVDKGRGSGSMVSGPDIGLTKELQVDWIIVWMTQLERGNNKNVTKNRDKYSCFY